MASATALPGWDIDPVPTRAVIDAVLDQVPLGVVAIDAASRRVLVANAEARRILRDPAATAADPMWLFSRSLEGETVRSEPVELLDREGSALKLQLSSRPVHDDEGRVVAAVVVFQDVTAREAQERAMADFVVNAAHQLQSPLTAIISSIEVLQSGAKDGPERDAFFSHLERESQRLARLVGALLTLARAETGVAASRRELIPLEPLLLRMARDAASSAVAAVTVECDEGLGVIASPHLVEQALQGVLDNAVKYTQSGTIKIRGRRRGESAELVVEDTGPGIALEEQERVFERFHRAGSVKGFGLGLAIVRAAVDALGGEIALDSEPGVGTTLTITLPDAATVAA